MNPWITERWIDRYREKSASKEQAIELIESGQKVFLAPFCNEPQTLVEELVAQKDRFQDVSLFNIIVGSPCLYGKPACHPHFAIRTFLGSPALQDAFLKNACEYVPMNLSDVPDWLCREKVDVALIQASPPDQDGYCNLGISVDVIQALVKNASLVIAELNPRLPHSHGETLLPMSDIDCFIVADRPLLTIQDTDPTTEEIAIGAFVADLIPDYATIQVGIGKLANSILRALKTKKGLGIHSGSITEPVMELMELGVITNEKKEVCPFKTVCTTIAGTDALYEYAYDNPNIELMPVDFTHNAAVISEMNHFYAINSALEVDLSGQVNAEQINGMALAGVGGQMDFIHGARLSKGGRSIIVLPSTAKGGKVSRITHSLHSVTSLKSEIDYIVTEYGVAELFGKTLKERKEAMIAIAHPAFREQLANG